MRSWKADWRPFCDRLLGRLAQNNVAYQVVAAKELPGDTGGKQRLHALYLALKRRQKLKIDSFGKKAVCAIFLDKDIDDLLRRTLRSPHVLYTRAYDLEGELFLTGDLHRATADAAGMTMLQAAQLLGKKEQWLERHQINWLDWTTLCVISQIKQVNVGCSFERPSAVNDQIIGPVDSTAVQNFKKNLGAKLGMGQPEIERLYQRYKRLVKRRINDDAGLKLFKGKWLSLILEREAAAKNTVPDVSLQALGQRVVAVLVSQVGNAQHCRCCAGYEPRIGTLMKQLQ